MKLRVGVFLCAVSALAAGTGEFQDRRQRAAAAFDDGILLVLAKSAAESWLFLRPQGRLESSIAKLKGPPEGSPGSDAVKQTGIELVADWSELASFLEKKSASPVVLYYMAVRSGSELPPDITADPRAPLWAVAIARKWLSYQLKFANARVSALMDVQSPSELVNVRDAAKATVQAVMAGIRAIRPGVSQQTVELAVADALLERGLAVGQGGTGWRLPGPLGFQNSL
jgi:Xaa-Pro aminopeptidase